MGLKEYRRRRNFASSSEPDASSLNFCVQKHAARHLHYDLRLEHRGVLLSWAIPKEPSLDPKTKRLAIQVEDHPLEYQFFEGIIPKGNYGAGTVEIWDRGFYTVGDATTPAEIEKEVSKGLKEGHLSVNFYGNKLHGTFLLQRLEKSAKKKEWLLIKKKAQADPKSLSPMLATLIEKPFTDKNWLFEIKWDGFRALAFVDHGQVHLQSRTALSLNKKFPAIVQELKKIQGQAVFDGELVVLDPQGKSHFQLIQDFQSHSKGLLCYYVFDLLFYHEEDLREQPLIERKERLKRYLKQLASPLIRYSDHIEAEGKALFEKAIENHLEGIIGKKRDSTYQMQRSREWVKMKTKTRQEVVIGGFTAPRGSRKKLGSLLVGLYDGKELVYAGHVGTGFTEASLETLFEALHPLIQKKSPFKIPPKPNAAVTWVKPKLVCEVAFAEWTRDQIMRQPVFQGLRTDKRASAVKREIPEPTMQEMGTHLDKLYWPKEKITKGNLLSYYEAIAPFILPYLKDRPIMLHRYPGGILGKHFYQKDLSSHPPWIKTYAVQHEEKVDHYLRIDDVKSLLYAINLGSIDLHPFTARYRTLDRPDFCVIDLDPQGLPFRAVVEVALAAHELLEGMKAPHFCKTSGGRGLHILIPLQANYSYAQARELAERLSLILHEKLPKITSMERSPQKRQKKVYLDCLQNRSGQTLVAPYAVRPRPKALVSTPLEWSEVTFDLEPTQFNMQSIQKRLKEKGDLLKPLLMLSR